MVRNAKSIGGGAKLPGGDTAILFKRTGNLCLKDEKFFLRHVFDGLLADAEILGENLFWRVGHPVGKQNGLILREVARRQRPAGIRSRRERVPEWSGECRWGKTTGRLR